MGLRSSDDTSSPHLLITFSPCRDYFRGCNYRVPNRITASTLPRGSGPEIASSSAHNAKDAPVALAVSVIRAGDVPLPGRRVNGTQILKKRVCLPSAPGLTFSTPHLFPVARCSHLPRPANSIPIVALLSPTTRKHAEAQLDSLGPLHVHPVRECHLSPWSYAGKDQAR